MNNDYTKLTVAKLKNILRDRCLKLSGKKKELIKRLCEDDELLLIQAYTTKLINIVYDDDKLKTYTPNESAIKIILEKVINIDIFIKLIKKIQPTVDLLEHICKSQYLVEISRTLKRYSDFYRHDVYYMHIIYLITIGVKPTITCLNNMIRHQKVLYEKKAMDELYKYIDPIHINKTDFVKKISGEPTKMYSYMYKYGESYEIKEPRLFSLYRFITRHGVKPNKETLLSAKVYNYKHIIDDITQ